MERKKISILGIDQTGAVSKTGKPKPLPVCFIQDDRVRLDYISELNFSSIITTFPESYETELRICVDCVLGLPMEIKTPWRTAAQRTLEIEGYGRKAASDFFRLLGQGQAPRRKVELLCQANSVFQEHPFQKNIQTGTYRLWKDLAQDHEKFYVPAIESKSSKYQIPLVEGYPSLSWKLLFGLKARSPAMLRKLISSSKIRFSISIGQQKLIGKDPNLADAYVLAVTLAQARRREILKYHGPEGWILGATQLRPKRAQ